MRPPASNQESLIGKKGIWIRGSPLYNTIHPSNEATPLISTGRNHCIILCVPCAQFSTWSKMSVSTLPAAGGLDVNELSHRLATIPSVSEEEGNEGAGEGSQDDNVLGSETSSTAAIFGSETGIYLHTQLEFHSAARPAPLLPFLAPKQVYMYTCTSS